MIVLIYKIIKFYILYGLEFSDSCKLIRTKKSEFWMFIGQNDKQNLEVFELWCWIQVNFSKECNYYFLEIWHYFLTFVHHVNNQFIIKLLLHCLMIINTFFLFSFLHFQSNQKKKRYTHFFFQDIHVQKVNYFSLLFIGVHLCLCLSFWYYFLLH